MKEKQKDVLERLEDFKVTITDIDSLHMSMRKVKKVLFQMIEDEFVITIEMEKATLELYKHLVDILQSEKSIRVYEHKFFLDGYLQAFESKITFLHH